MNLSVKKIVRFNFVNGEYFGGVPGVNYGEYLSSFGGIYINIHLHSTIFPIIVMSSYVMAYFGIIPVRLWII
jgi:hypothetical protein